MPISRARPSRAALLPLALIVVCAGLARADKRQTDEANRLVEESVRDYRGGQYREASALLRRAYQLTPVPVLLFDLGRALDKAGDREGAIAAYQQYLDVAPTAGDREMVSSRVAELERAIAAEHAPPPEAVPVVEPMPVATVAFPPPPPKRWYKRWWVWTIVGVAAAGVGVGLGVGLTRHTNDFPATLPQISAP